MVILLPYEITLFSNAISAITTKTTVLLPYEITLFSNSDATTIDAVGSFTTL